MSTPLASNQHADAQNKAILHRRSASAQKKRPKLALEPLNQCCPS
jgi:hypothetical protein